MSPARLPGEFELIERYFAPLAEGAAGAFGLRDDAALVDPSPGCRLVVTADGVIAGVHFHENDPPDLIARKALRVNLSDLAGKGARPLAYFMTVAFGPGVDEAWVAGFAAGLAADQATYGIKLMGGDTAATPGPTTVSITAIGEVRDGYYLRRGGAAAGDVVMVSGTIGDGALGLLAGRGELRGLDEAHRAFLLDRYRLPQPRSALGPALAQAALATAALDVSDGLAADLGHMAAQSRLRATIDVAHLPLSDAAAAALAGDRRLLATILGGGDDYELLVAVPDAGRSAAEDLGDRLGVPLTAIGRLEAGEGVRILDESGEAIALGSTGYKHF